MMIPTHYLQTFTACVTSLEDGPSCTTAQRLRLKTHSGVGDCITLMSNYLKLQKNNTDRRIDIIGSSGWEIPIFKHGFFKTHLSMPERIAQSTQILWYQTKQALYVSFIQFCKSWSCPDCRICLKHLTKFNCLFTNLAFSLHVMEPFVSLLLKVRIDSMKL